jgi:predicted nucleotidyltransferase
MIKFEVTGRLFELNLERSIETIAVFGSCARGENDERSDIDLLFIIDDCNNEEFLRKKEGIINQLKVPEGWISVYKKSSIENMNKYSSYFLWHLKLESKIIFSRNNFLEEVFENINEYKKVKSDLNQYQNICKDIRNLIKYDIGTYKYELSILASIARNTCMTLCYIINKKSFGRIEPIEISIDYIGESFPFSIEEYNNLYEYRISYKRENSKLSINQGIEKYINCWIDKIENLIDIVKNEYIIREG